jgi:rRNA biogenesis protein RRP5
VQREKRRTCGEARYCLIGVAMKDRRQKWLIAFIYFRSVAGRQKSLADRVFVSCRILSTPSSEKGPFEGSLRYSRIEGDLDDDDPPDVGDTVQAFVIDTNSKGCFVRLSRRVQGRAMLKELCDGFLPDPAAAFPMGRLVVGKVKQIKPASSSENSFVVDVDMRESSLLDRKTQLCFDQVEIGSKYKGTVTRIEDYGVFVRLEGSEVSGLVHKSECSDKYVKTLSTFYDPGDLVKVLVLKKDEQKKTLGFSMKSSHFEDDEDSDVESIDEVSGIDHSDDNDSFDNQSIANIAAGRVADEAESGSDDESEGSVENSESGSDEEKHVSSDSSNKPDEKSFADILDMNVGFDWNGTRSTQSHTRDQDSVDEDDSSEDEANEDELHKLNHKSRRKQAQRRQEEQDIARREIALADGTANDNPETASDFERLLASSPNSSELWIRYMAFHLTLADIPAAREVAERAFQRIEFRQEGEKLNVWCALLTLELKYGSSTCLKATIERACQHNNPKKIHLRVCEMMEKEATEKSSVGTTERTDDMFSKMCKKFKSKKTVWLAHAKYLLRLGRHEEAYALSKRALLSLPAYKHVELMSKFAQLVFEYNSAEKARTLFDGLLQKNPKRLDILFVYVDKEVKYGEAETARSLFEKVAGKEIDSLQMKLSDKQMKSLFKKWFSFEEQHGTAKTQERVKEAARAYVESSS